MSRHELFRRSWNDVVVRATSPNGCVHLTLQGDRDVRLTCDDTWFHRSTLTDFTDQLARTFRLALVQRTQTYNRHREMVTGHVVTPIDGSRNPHLQTFVDRRDSLLVEGGSADGRVSITAVGLRRFVVTVDPDLWAARDRGAVERGLQEAGNALLRDQFAKMYELKQAGH